MDYVIAFVVAAAVSLSLYFLLINAHQEVEPGLGLKGGEVESDPRTAPAEHAEKPA